ncbi:MAG: hypothetical protein WBH92_00740, partial [Flavobacteriaceae bacterium]
MSLFTGFLFTHLMGWSQEIITDDRSDFDLKGPVKSCFVFTKYGQEQYQFNKTGQLVEAATVFGENDSETTYYKYEKAKLVERRVENYVNGVLDKTTSMANFYSYDSIPQLKIKEKIIGYDRTFVAQFNYRYDSIGQLTRVVRTNTQGRFITLISHQWDSLRTKKSTAYWLDSVPLKQIDSIFLKAGGTLSQLKTKEFDNGIPNALELRVFNKKGLEIELHSTIYIEKDALLVPKKASSVRTKYDSNNHPIEQIFERGVVRQTKKNLYQLDGSPFKNWIKKITTPDNTYT